MTEKRIIKVCPDCDSAHLRTITAPWSGERGHYCETCKTHIEPTKREAKASGTGSELVDKLSEMNPDELSG